MALIRQAVILAGGLGTRLRPLTDDRPKPMIELGGKPFLEYLIGLLRENGISEAVLLLGYMPEKITGYFGDGKKFGMNIRYSATPAEDETGTRIKKAREMLDERFLLLYSDNYWPLDLAKLVSFHEKSGCPATVTAYANKDNYSRNNLKIAGGIVERYDPARAEEGLNGVDIGFFIIDKKVLEEMPEGNFSFEKTIFANLVAEKKVAGYLTDHKYYSIGNLARLPLTEKFLSHKKIVFLDRDGVINEKPPKAEYVKNWSEFKFLPGAVEGMKILADKGYKLIVISNQAGIARGMMSEDDLQNIHERMASELIACGVKLSGIYYCPHGWDEDCFCRKPKPGMFFLAAAKHHIDLTKSIFIGDDERDRAAGEVAWVKTILTRPGCGLLEISKELG